MTKANNDLGKLYPLLDIIADRICEPGRYLTDKDIKRLLVGIPLQEEEFCFNRLQSWANAINLLKLNSGLIEEFRTRMLGLGVPDEIVVHLIEKMTGTQIHHEIQLVEKPYNNNEKEGAINCTNIQREEPLSVKQGGILSNNSQPPAETTTIPPSVGYQQIQQPFTPPKLRLIMAALLFLTSLLILWAYFAISDHSKDSDENQEIIHQIENNTERVESATSTTYKRIIIRTPDFSEAIKTINSSTLKTLNVSIGETIVAEWNNGLTLTLAPMNTLAVTFVLKIPTLAKTMTP